MLKQPFLLTEVNAFRLWLSITNWPTLVELQLLTSSTDSTHPRVPNVQSRQHELC